MNERRIHQIFEISVLLKGAHAVDEQRAKVHEELKRELEPRVRADLENALDGLAEDRARLYDEIQALEERVAQAKGDAGAAEAASRALLDGLTEELAALQVELDATPEASLRNVTRRKKIALKPTTPTEGARIHFACGKWRACIFGGRLAPQWGDAAMSQRRRISQWDLEILRQQREELERLIEDMRWARAKREEEERERIWRRITAGRPLPPRRARKRSAAPARSRQVRSSRKAIVHVPVPLSRDRKPLWDAASSTPAGRPATRDRVPRAHRHSASVPEPGTARDAAAALAQTRRLGRPANSTGAVAFYARTTAVSRTSGAPSDGSGAASADRLAAKVDYYTRHGGDEAAGDTGPKPVPDMASAVDARLAYFERAGAPVEAIEDGDVLAIISNMGPDRAVRRGVARAAEKAERSWTEGGLNRTRAASAELATTQVYELPHELELPRLARLIEKLVEPIAAEGVFYLAVIHRPPAEGDQRNIHLHLLWTHRPGRLLEDGAIVFQPKKTRALRGPAFLKEMRRRFAELANAAFAEVGAEKPPHRRPASGPHRDGA